MEKIQKFPKTVGSAINVQDPTDTTSTGDDTNLNTTLENLAGGMLTHDMKTYLEDQLSSKLKDEIALSLVITPDSGSDSYKADVTPSASMAVTYRLKSYVVYGPTGSKTTKQVDLDAVPNGWAKDTSKTGEYTCTLSYASSKMSVAEASVSYTVVSAISEKYAGITVSGKVLSKTISVSYPVYWGFYESQSAPTGDNAATLLKAILVDNAFIGAYGSTSGARTLTNSTNKESYLWVVCRNTATVKQTLNEHVLLSGSLTGQSFVSLNNSDITMSGYKIFRSENTVSAGGSVDFSTFTAN